MIRAVILCVAMMIATQVRALDLTTPFGNIDGGTLALSQWQGRPILVVNTASRCAYTKQYAGLQQLYDTYRQRGLVVLAVPSDDFRQELSSEQEVKDFCEVQFGLDLPMTDITHVKGPDAHPFYRSLRQEEGYSPKWNYSKVLLGPDGTVAATYSSRVGPMSAQIAQDIEALLQ